MDDQQRILTGKIIRIIMPGYFFAIIVFYLLGAGIYRFLGGEVDWDLFFTGMACVLLLHSSSMLLKAFFDGQNSERTRIKSLDKKALHLDPQVVNKTLLSTSLAALASGCVFTYSLALQNALTPSSYFVLGIAFLCALSYSIPPFKLASHGMGEVVLAILMANIYPSFAFLLQNGEMHRLVAMITFPLTPMLLATLISSGLPTYLQDMLDQKKTLLQVLQWKAGMDLHNLLIFIAYLILAMAALFNLSRALIWPYVVALPLSLLSVYEVLRIKSGSKPRWAVLLLGSYGSTGCTVYLITFALWTG